MDSDRLYRNCEQNGNMNFDEADDNLLTADITTAESVESDENVSKSLVVNRIHEVLVTDCVDNGDAKKSEQEKCEYETEQEKWNSETEQEKCGSETEQEKSASETEQENWNSETEQEKLKTETEQEKRKTKTEQVYCFDDNACGGWFKEINCEIKSKTAYERDENIEDRNCDLPIGLEVRADDELQASGMSAEPTAAVFDKDFIAINEEYTRLCNSDNLTFYDALLHFIACGESLTGFTDGDTLFNAYSDIHNHYELTFGIKPHSHDADLEFARDDSDNLFDNSENNCAVFNEDGSSNDLVTACIDSSELSCDSPRPSYTYSQPRYIYCDCGDVLVAMPFESSSNCCEDKSSDEVNKNDIVVNKNDKSEDPPPCTDECTEEPNYSSSLCYFDDMPQEILYNIMSYLTPQELTKYVAPVCQTWHGLSRESILWTHLSGLENVQFCLSFWSTITKATHLRHLSLSGRHDLTIDEILHFSGRCPNLLSIDLSFCDTLTDSLLSFVLRRFKCLESISLKGSNITDTSLEVFTSCVHVVHCVNLSYCTSITNEGLISLTTAFHHLTKLNIDGIQWIYDSGIETLVEYHQKHLVSLELDGEQLTDRSMAAISRCLKLTRFSVWFCTQLTDVSLVYLKELTELRHLTLRKGETFSDHALADLFSSGEKSLTQLRSINLTECKCLTDDIIHQICANLGGQLHKLSVSWCWDLTEAAVERIVNSCRYMTCLNLMGVWMDDGSCFNDVPDLMPYLTHMSLENCKNVEDDIIMSVIKRKPDLKVVDYYGMLFDPNKPRWCD